jgi:FkbM family methyltransferase
MQDVKGENLSLLFAQIEEAGFGVDRTSQQIRLPDWCISVKIDVGLSHNAPMTSEWLRRQPEGLVVFCFEPLEGNIQSSKHAIRKLIETNGIKSRAVFLQFALGQSEGIQDMFVTPDAGQSSFLEPIKAEVVRLERVRVTRLESLLRLFDWDKNPRVDFLKTDCQGTDIEVLLGAGDLLGKVAIVTSEAESSSYRGAKNNGKSIASLMDRSGFKQLNPRPAYRVFLGELIKKFDSIHALYLRLIADTPAVSKQKGGSISTEDPTFLNKEFEDLINAGGISAFQKG